LTQRFFNQLWLQQTSSALDIFQQFVDDVVFRTSTPASSAACLAPLARVVLNPMITALLAAAKSISVSVISPGQPTTSEFGLRFEAAV
jgi:hypothetical protein